MTGKFYVAKHASRPISSNTKSRVDEFATRVVEQVKQLRMGHGLDPDVQIGPLINQRGLQKVQSIIDDAVNHGATLHLGGTSANGLFLTPTILSGVTENMAASHQEIFGPVIAIRHFDSDEEAIQLANATPWGLAAYAFTQYLKRSWRVSEALEFGMIGLNTGRISTAQAPFGGIKQSGMGREAVFK